MTNLSKLPHDSDLDLGNEPSSLAGLIRHEPRGAAVDQSAMIARSALEVPTLPDVTEANEREQYRQKLIAANLALNGSQFNSAAKGAVTGMAVACGVVVIATLWKIVKSILMARTSAPSRAMVRR